LCPHGKHILHELILHFSPCSVVTTSRDKSKSRHAASVLASHRRHGQRRHIVHSPRRSSRRQMQTLVARSVAVTDAALLPAVDSIATTRRDLG
jgi:hypothetical protein